MTEFKLDDESIHVMMFRSSKSLIIEMITDDQEAINLTQLALWNWFLDHGLSEGTIPPSLSNIKTKEDDVK